MADNEIDTTATDSTETTFRNPVLEADPAVTDAEKPATAPAEQLPQDAAAEPTEENTAPFTDAEPDAAGNATGDAEPNGLGDGFSDEALGGDAAQPSDADADAGAATSSDVALEQPAAEPLTDSVDGHTDSSDTDTVGDAESDAEPDAGTVEDTATEELPAASEPAADPAEQPELDEPVENDGAAPAGSIEGMEPPMSHPAAPEEANGPLGATQDTASLPASEEPESPTATQPGVILPTSPVAEPANEAEQPFPVKHHMPEEHPRAATECHRIDPCTGKELPAKDQPGEAGVAQDGANGYSQEAQTAHADMLKEIGDWAKADAELDARATAIVQRKIAELLQKLSEEN